MPVKKYRAKNMRDALAMVSRDFGSDAMLVETREVRKPCFFGLTYRRFVEVVATSSVADDVPRLSETPTEDVPKPEEKTTEDAGCDLSGFASANLTEYRSLNLFTEGDFFDQIPGISRKAVSANPLTQTLPPEEMDIPAQIQNLLKRIFVFLCEIDMDEASARSLVSELKQEAFCWFETHRTFSGLDAEKLRKKLFSLICSGIQTTGSMEKVCGSHKIVAFVGPAGAGKTTTITKLAAYYHLRKKWRVGLITLDTFRMAAVEQLQACAHVIGVPLYVAGSPRQVREAVDRMSDFDLILVDTAGRSHKEELRIHELRAMLEEVEADEVCLVLSASSRPKVAAHTVETFAPVGTTSLVLTKLDETPGLGSLYPLAVQSGLPIRWVTTGQSVPGDFQPANAETLTGWILGEEPSAPSFPAEETYNKAA